MVMEACDFRTMKIQQKTYFLLGCALFLLMVYWSSPYETHHASLKMDQRPSFVLILTDDQDVVLEGMWPMQHTKMLVAEQGLTFTNAFVASPLCCPSRSSILTGQYVHNHYTINNSLSGQCNGQHWRDGPEKKTFAAHLHFAGYQTFYAGKYLNQYGHTAAGGLSHVPPGWDWWLGLKGNSRYYNYSLSVNGSKETHDSHPDKDYLTKVIWQYALDFLAQLSTHPFLIVLAPPAPHAPFIPEPKYATNFSSLKAPRTPNFNVKVTKEKHWLLRQGKQILPDEVVVKIDRVFQSRLCTLLTVDDMVKDVVEKLKALSRLDNTFVIFTSDNGYHLGQFSQPLDKREPYETDIRVPLVMRGPDLPKGHILSYPTTNIDLAPTLLDLASVPIPNYMDGTSLKSVLTNSMANYDRTQNEVRKMGRHNPKQLRRTVLVEHNGEGTVKHPGCENLSSGVSGCNPDFACKCEDSWNNTYACLRQLSSHEDRLFCQWADDEDFEEVYDLTRDPWQLNNTIAYLPPGLHKKLHNLLHNLQHCQGLRCSDLAGFVV
ncbi:N-acetylglucosamine-6-sulfatase-like isoform X1 [Portunus trituberculatus]|uniref:N-acetylglucosamine-6-sulfatase-like isoform X1 n=2 Tax=Portunus trituberculatus TaxID=210409 RepID=UPI001E1CD74C|nr:N-acetylglucosamine-6-sulfatase-like isoform X1 [Portunus trituberculatus]XP_045104770.1 N-acetylglucosamine-6-sulfatase-like isoform X1 [Portunus trituberculatus]XP_045104771.1 N-acetylglucosamine-6-sulfatase-like isoform X1 [Portunus trituberculatus]XP_045104772.1 N-acetylglucosamine-6-sulfatase-like isoform X1 [Portunus trituberculatus]XP_045104773.1 N-acetylglucosamine-6-sulfatase-like isoform X1 [Portunus trituberculatus]